MDLFVCLNAQLHFTMRENFQCHSSGASDFLLNSPNVFFSFGQNLSHLLLTLRAGEQAGIKGEAVFKLLDYCVNCGLLFGV